MHRLFENLTYDGFWWLPELTEIKLTGRLTLEAGEQIKLVLMMSSEQYYSHFERFLSLEIIQGYTTTGRELTLLYCHVSGNHTSNHLNIETIQYSPELLLDGRCYNKAHEILFNSAIFNYTNLRDWMRTSISLDTNVHFGADSTIHMARYERKKPNEIRLDSIGATLQYGLSLVDRSSFPSGIDWKEDAFIEIIPDAPQPLEWFLNQSATLQYLLAILIGLPVYRTELSGLDSRNGNPRPIMIFYHIKVNKMNASSTFPDVMLFALEHLEERVSEVFQAWFESYESLRTTYELILGVLYRGHSFTRFEFLSLIQALEGYHRYKYPNCKKYTQKGSRECFLSERLDELYGLLPSELQAEVGLNQPFLKMKSIVDTRNYFSHNGHPTADVFNGDSLYNATIGLTTFLLALIFKEELHLSGKEIKQALLRTRGYGVWWRQYR